MRRWSTSSRRRAEPPLWAVRLLAVLLAVPLVGAGCVTRGEHRKVLGERDRLAVALAALQKRLTLLEASNESLSQERVKLLDSVETLREAQASLEQSVAELQEQRDALERDLEARAVQLEETSRELGTLRATYDGLVTDLQKEVAQGRIQIEQLRDGLRVNLAQEILFPLGSAQLDPGGRELLRKVAARLRGIPQRIEVRGHTDALPIYGRLALRYPSNWELAGARAARVVRLFAEAGVERERMRAVSLADTQPVADNESEEGRARNRRIELRLLPEEAPAGAADPAEVGGAAAPGALVTPAPAALSPGAAAGRGEPAVPDETPEPSDPAAAGSGGETPARARAVAPAAADGAPSGAPAP